MKQGGQGRQRGVRDVTEIGMDFGADGIAEDDRAGWTCRRSICDWYLTEGIPSIKI